MCIALQSIDWTNAVFVQVVMMATLGILLAIYTGLVASRAFAFYQARYRTLIWILHADAIRNAGQPSPADFYTEFSRSILPVVMEFRALGHEDAAQKVGAILAGYTHTSAEILAIKYDETRLPDFPYKMQPEAALKFMVAIQEYSKTRLPVDIATCAELVPSWSAIFSFIPFPNYITYKRRLIGMLVRRKSRWDFIQGYLNGETEDWK